MMMVIVLLVLLTACNITNNNVNQSSKLITDSLPIPNLSYTAAIETPEIILFWTSCKGADSYEMYTSDLSDFSTSLSIYFGKDTLISPTGPNRKSYFKVRSIYGSQTSQWSNIVHR